MQNRPPTETEKQIISRQQQQQTDLNSEIQSQQVQSPNVRFEAEKTKTHGFPQQEAQCFPIHQLVLTDFDENNENKKLIQPSRFHWALNAVYAERDFALPACIGAEGINVLLRRIQNRLIDFGYITTRVLVEPQDLRSGMLVLTVIPGK
ncbi:POTRA domain-containing protein, partial [Rodentibacter heidelbergensis]|uniref:POTRA domain-containing protein n=1 Tax=Rodentibacter heidelbergensis TaxID=1908258 RepID=UPI00244AD16F